MKTLELEIDMNHQNASRWKILIFSFVLVFLFTLLSQMGFSFSKKDFSDSTAEPVINKLIPMLNKTKNNFAVKPQQQIVSGAYAASDFDNATSYAAIDYNTGQVIMQKNLDKPVSIASLTKIMTAVVALDLAKYNEKITISKKAANEEPTKIGVVPGQKMTVEELIDASLMTSANDAAQALRDGINQKYGANVFVDAMNEKAKFLGLTDTKFTNPQGFDIGDNHSSAKDLAVLTEYALKNYPIIRKAVSQDYVFLAANNYHKQFDLYNWNGLLDVYPGVTGMKIGNTDNAGYTTIVVSERNGKKIIAVLLGAPGIIQRDLWTSQLLDSAFEKIDNLSPVSLTQADLMSKYSTWKYWN